MWYRNAKMATELLSLTLADLKQQIQSLGMPGFIATQIWEWVFHHNQVDFDAMSNISKSNRAILDSHFAKNPFRSIEAIPSADRLATKYVFKLDEDNAIEAVALSEKGYTTLCVSSQCGCPVNCQFCLTGVAGFRKNLSADAIVRQVIAARAMGEPVTHLVFMGMGEPLLNLAAVLTAIEILTDPAGLGISRRKITVSTSGILAGIRALTSRNIPLNLAFSVGSTDPQKRLELMPITKTNPLPDVIAALQAYLSLHNRKLTLEYTLLENENDKMADAVALAKLAKLLRAKVNLINLNPHSRIPYRPVNPTVLGQFKRTIHAQGVPVTIRFRKGQDIAAACGQLGESILS